MNDDKLIKDPEELRKTVDKIWDKKKQELQSGAEA